MLSNEPQNLHLASYTSSAAPWWWDSVGKENVLFFWFILLYSFLINIALARCNFVQILIKTRFLNEVTDVKWNIYSCLGSVGCTWVNQHINSSSSPQCKVSFSIYSWPVICWEKTHDMALNFKGFSTPAGQNSCECGPSQQGKLDEGLGLNFSSDYIFLLNCLSALRVFCVCSQACIWMEICTLLSQLFQKVDQYFMPSLHWAY